MRHILLFTIALLLAGTALLSADEVVSTILISGLKHVDREILLSDLSIHEGDRVGDNLARRLRSRAHELSYLSGFKVDTQSLADGAHLSLRVRERPRFQLQPLIGTLDDGDLVGGMRLRSFSLLRRGESWDATVLTGSMAVLRLRMSGLPIAGPISLAIDFELKDWESPFLGAEQRNWHYLAGLQARLPRAGRLTLLGGWETQSTRPARGLPNNEGEDSQALFTGRLRQPTGLAGIALVARGEMRIPESTDQYLWGEAGIDQLIRPGRWRFHTRLLHGGASWKSPAFARPFLSSWDWFHAYDPDQLETRAFSFTTLRGDLRIFHIPIKMKRRGPELAAPVTVFFHVSAARHRMDPAADWSFAGEGGMGIALQVPQYDLRVSMGGFITREEEFKFVMILEDILP